jgi:hypothetical protein
MPRRRHRRVQARSWRWPWQRRGLGAAVALRQDAARFRAIQARGPRELTRLVAEDRAAHCVVSPEATICRYHVLLAVLDASARHAAQLEILSAGFAWRDGPHPVAMRRDEVAWRRYSLL